MTWLRTPAKAAGPKRTVPGEGGNAVFEVGCLRRAPGPSAADAHAAGTIARPELLTRAHHPESAEHLDGDVFHR